MQFYCLIRSRVAKIPIVFATYLEYGFNGTPSARLVRACRASIRDKSRRSRLRKKPRRKIWYPTWTGVVGTAASEIESRRETISFFPPFPSSSPPPFPFFVERASHGGREWNRDVLGVTINGASLAHGKIKQGWWLKSRTVKRSLSTFDRYVPRSHDRSRSTRAIYDSIKIVTVNQEDKLMDKFKFKQVLTRVFVNVKDEMNGHAFIYNYRNLGIFN